ncbi:MAG TPA: uroporphyrinogen-III C-methyltransferase [Rhodanobacteraceae bacterium]|nr:uroporphyrinogen-III C-methyltransferase [Rhodanobacteraceae bacterium]
MGEQQDSEVTEARPLVERNPPEAPAAPRPRSGAAIATLLALAALILAGFGVWRVVMLERGAGDAASALREDVDRRLADAERTAEQRKRDIDTMRSRLADTDTVNKGVREELLALGERSRHLEDAVANLAEQRLTGRDALALNEAEFLLQLADERLSLFHDADAALGAYRLADSALAAAEDPVFAGVRQTISAEMQALAAAKPLESNAAIAALERIRTNLATLPAKAAATTANATPSRFEALLQQFVRVSHEEGAAPGSRDLELARSLASIDLRAAQAALLARDPSAYTAALSRARTSIAASFDPAAQPVKESLAEIDRLAAAPLAPALPELGTALRELRNLRATRALTQPRAAAPAPSGAGS